MSDRTIGCRDLLAHLSAYLDGDLAAAECHVIERHCRDCAECARAVDGLRRTIGLCQHAGRAPLPESVRERARASVRKLLVDKSPRTAPRD